MTFRRDPAGFAEILKAAETVAAINDLAHKVAKNVDDQGLSAHSAGEHSGTKITAEVESYTTDRAAASVGILHPAALAMQAKHGVLTKAAAEAGLEVKTK